MRANRTVVAAGLALAVVVSTLFAAPAAGAIVDGESGDSHAVVGDGPATHAVATTPGPRPTDLPAAADEPSWTARSAAASTTSVDPIRVQYTLQLTPETTDQVLVRAEVQVPDSVADLEARLPSGATLMDTDGFRRGGNYDLEWDGDRNPASFSYVVPVNSTSPSVEGLSFTDTGEWALVDLDSSQADFRFFYSGETAPDVVERFAVADEGYAGPSFAYLGAYESSSRRGVQRFTLVVPATAELPTERARILDAFAAASSQLDVGDVDGQVNVFVAPPPVRGGGLAAEDADDTADVIVSQRSRLTVADNVWLHEYVHTRQTYDASERMDWFDEGSAEYYGALLAVRQGLVTWDGFARHVSDYEDGVLAEVGSSPTSNAEYSKGSLVLAALDARIRQESAIDATLLDVFRAMNDHDGPVDYGDFQAFVEEAAGTSLDDWLDRYVLGDEVPAFPDDPALFTHPGGNRDADGDGLSADREEQLGTNPFKVDTDGDGLADGREVELGTDPTERDTDGDRLDDRLEVEESGTDPTAADTDGDGLDDGAEVLDYESDPTEEDTDLDGLADGVEANEHGTDPTQRDTDSDRLTDAREVGKYGTDPTERDTDGDGLGDAAELREHGTDPTERDTDGDGLADGAELNEHGSDPTETDTDGDGLADGVEVNEHGTDPTERDTDGDGHADDRELEVGTDPTSSTGFIGWWLAVLLDALGLVALPARVLPAAAIVFPVGAVSAGAVYRT